MIYAVEYWEIFDWKTGSEAEPLPTGIIARLFSYQANDILKISSDKIKALLAGGLFLVSAERFELSTNGLKGHCSAIELRAHLLPLVPAGKITFERTERGCLCRLIRVLLRHFESGLHSNMGDIHRQRKTPFDHGVYRCGGSNG
jgi:hypothetical protein